LHVHRTDIHSPTYSFNHPSEKNLSQVLGFSPQMNFPAGLSVSFLFGELNLKVNYSAIAASLS
jgi:hypothetical protein